MHGLVYCSTVGNVTKVCTDPIDQSKNSFLLQSRPKDLGELWARRAPPSLIDYFKCRYTTSSLIFCTKPYMDVRGEIQMISESAYKSSASKN